MSIRPSPSFLPRLGGLCAALVLLSALWAEPSRADDRGFGPFPVRNFQPIQLLFLGLSGERGAVVPKGTLDIRVEMANTAAVFEESSASHDAEVKLETLRSALFLRYGLTDRLEVSAELPTLYRHQGFMEGAIRFVERLTTGIGGARERLDGTNYVFDIRQNGRDRFSGGDGALGLGDLSLLAKWQVLDEGPWKPLTSLRLGLKLPTGDSGRFFGSGHTDVGLGLAVEKKLASRWLVYGNLNVVFPTGDVSGLELDPIPSGMAAVEYLWTPALSLTLQFEYYGTPFDDTGVKLLDRGVTEVTAGVNYRLRDNVLWSVYGVENVDFTTESSADFTVSTLVTYRFTL